MIYIIIFIFIIILYYTLEQAQFRQQWQRAKKNICHFLFVPFSRDLSVSIEQTEEYCERIMWKQSCAHVCGSDAVCLIGWGRDRADKEMTLRIR